MRDEHDLASSGLPPPGVAIPPDVPSAGEPGGDHELLADAGSVEGGEDAGKVEDEIASPVDLGRRFTNWRTLVSFLIAVAILALALYKLHINRDDLGAALHKVNPLLFLAAFVVYYASFPLRTVRWKRLMINANVGDDLEMVKAAPLKDLLEILYLSWFANCVIPAKLGDVYRAYLVKKTVGLSASRTVGTIVAERILDLIVLFPLLLTAAILTFHNRLLDDSTLRFVLISAFGLGMVAVAVIVGIWRLGEGLRRMLPRRIHSIFIAFREGAVRSYSKDVPLLVGLSIVIWICEGGRLFLVLAALGMVKQGEVGPSAAIFLALGSSVLTTLPLTPGGAGVVDTFLIAAFKVLKHGATGGQAAALALLDRIISYLSIVVIGFVLYLVSPKTKSALPNLGGEPVKSPGIAPAVRSNRGGSAR